jgi:hypothetical protein
MLHAVLVGEADVEDLYAIGRSLGDLVDYLLHLSVRRVMITDIETENCLRSRDARSVFASGVEVELLFDLRYRCDTTDQTDD